MSVIGYETESTTQELTATQGADFLDAARDQVFLVDPRAQGYGLGDIESLDGYANKFLLLAGGGAVYISPRAIPQELLNYYRDLGLDIPEARNILTVESAVDGGPVVGQLIGNFAAHAALATKENGLLVPYMVTPEAEYFADLYRLRTAATAEATDEVADKGKLQQKLAEIDDELARDTGFNVAIPTVEALAGDRESLRRGYAELSQKGTEDVVLVKPKSASALGITIVRAAQGELGFFDAIEKLDDGERILIEERVRHNHAPSAQGSRAEGGAYQHHYLGRQLISEQDGGVTYDGNQIPFGPSTVPIRSSEIKRLEDLHTALGERLVGAGIAGFDALVHVLPDGSIDTVKVTEANLHLPGSMAVYGALRQLFPDGFRGIAHNIRVPLHSSIGDFFVKNAELLVKGKGQYGLFPINMSYTDKVDVVLLARDAAHLKQLQERVGA